MTFSFIGTCVENPFKTLAALEGVIDRARPCAKKTFLQSVELENELIADIHRFPRDFTFSRSSFKGKTILFYTWSCIEHFFMED